VSIPGSAAVGSPGAGDAALSFPVDGAAAPVNILIVDDQPENLIALEAILEHLGQNIVQARSGREALRALLEIDAAVILLDVKMPEMDGFETAELIRERDRSRATPIIFLTAADRNQTLAERGYAVGAVDYLLKPVVPEFVRSKVAVFVELAKKNQLLERQAALLRQGEQAARELAEARAELVADLEHKNRELQTFSYAVSHDLRAPLRRIEGFGRALQESHAAGLDDEGRKFLDRIRGATAHMSELIDAMLHLSRVTRTELREQQVDLSALAAEIAAQLTQSDPSRSAEFIVRPGVEVTGDARLLRTVLQNLFDNAWKFTASRSPAHIEFGVLNAHAVPVYFVRDDGVGFDMAYRDRLFAPFQRLHNGRDFSGTGIGLATVQRIIERHGGTVWAEAAPEQGATFSFTLPKAH
jgi:two-component system, sensor histidine kinase and response regulator